MQLIWSRHSNEADAVFEEKSGRPLAPLSRWLVLGGTFRPMMSVLLACVLTQVLTAQNRPVRIPSLPDDRFKSGTATLRSFIPVAEATRDSIVRLVLDGKVIALGAVIATNGLAITKASEIKSGKLMCRVAEGSEFDATVIASDEDNDVALLKIGATGLKPIEWVFDDTTVGQWAVTPGIETSPEAVGIVSVPARKIFPKRAFVGVVLAPNAVISEIRSGFGAEKAGLKAGDMILAVNDAPIKDREELTNTLRNFREGQTVKLRVLREEEEFDASVQLKLDPPPTFGGGRRGNRQDRMNRMGSQLSQRAEGFQQAIQHDTVLQPWQCGGPLVNLKGKAIGLNIARAGRVASYALPAALVKQIIETLKTQAETTVKHEPSPEKVESSVKTVN